MDVHIRYAAYLVVSVSVLFLLMPVVQGQDHEFCVDCKWANISSQAPAIWGKSWGFADGPIDLQGAPGNCLFRSRISSTKQMCYRPIATELK